MNDLPKADSIPGRILEAEAVRIQIHVHLLCT